MHITALIAGLALLVLTVTPVAANPDWKHEGHNQGSNDVQDLRMIEILQVAHARGLNIRDLLTILREV